MVINKNYSILFLLVIALVQLYIPAKMIWGYESIIQNGAAHKFKTAPIDPADPFRGRYIRLDFEATSTAIPDASIWDINQEIFVQFRINAEGFSEIADITKSPPEQQADFVKAKVDYVIDDSIPKIFIEYPFTRYYMEESKAPYAEEVVFKAATDSNSVTYALVYIKNGTAVIKDVLINNESLKELSIKKK